MARDSEGALIDPYHGADDLKAGVLRHVSAAFAEDPVRILRVARFAARFGFAIADETLALMRQMVDSGEADALVAERVWQELSRGLMEAKPSRMFDALRACGALARVLPEVDALWGVPQRAEHHPEVDTGVHVMMVLDYAASRDYTLAVRFAALTHDLGKATTPREEWPRHHAHEERSVELVAALCERLRVPTECRDLALVMARQHGNVHRAAELRPTTIVQILQSADAFRKPQRFMQLLQACESDARGRLGLNDRPYPQAERMAAAHKAAAAVDAGAIAQRYPERIKEEVYQARVAAVRAVLNEVA
jgi:tRNA nucleotidyltransferase (CCA-adding enzyme)